jgi:prepilin-type N-terminal cleavage/methylation domain-containing protein
MMSPPSAPPAPNNRGPAHLHSFRRGFTFVELMVVILIIAILTGLILGAVHLAKKKSAIAKTRADLAAITTALEQYHTDFRTYPGLSEPINKRTILAQALIGPGPKEEDGADGSGFRIPSPDPATGAMSFGNYNSKKWDAYLSPEHFKVQQFSGGWAILDYFGNPIRYYPKRRNFNPKQGPLADNTGNGIFDIRDGEHPQSGAIDLTQETLWVYLGDLGTATVDPNNKIDGDESFRGEANFILASPGPDGVFLVIMPKEKLSSFNSRFSSSDDILNFEFK